jgi:hydrogenase maturation protein HypF
MRERRIVRLSGRVQGIGFRERILEIARDHQVFGFVRNSGVDLEIDVEGRPGDVSHFLSDVIKKKPPGASVSASTIVPGKALGRSNFVLEATEPQTP